MMMCRAFLLWRALARHRPRRKHWALSRNGSATINLDYCDAHSTSEMGHSRRTQAPQCFAQCPLCLRLRPN